MGYMHIENLYRPDAQKILLFRECYALEKVHGTSAHVSWKDGQIRLSPGGESAARFSSLFDEKNLSERFVALGQDSVIIYGEAYGGKQQGMGATYGDRLQFIVFDVLISDSWLSVPNAHAVAEKLGLEFVPYKKISTDLAEIDAERDAPSEVAVRRGIADPKPREGVVLRPVMELKDNNGERIVAKHKRDDFRETRTPRQVSPEAMKVLEDATAVADEWVTPMRLRHVMDKLGPELGMKDTPRVISAMVDDVLREGSGEIVDSKDARKAISNKARELFVAHVREIE